MLSIVLLLIISAIKSANSDLIYSKGVSDEVSRRKQMRPST